MISHQRTYIIGMFLFAVLIATGTPELARAASSDFEVTGWIPYWRAAEGARDARRHLDELTSLHPFGFGVRDDGTLTDLTGLGKSHWKRLFRDAKKEEVDIVPTVMWSNGARIHAILSDPTLRGRHIEEIVEMVEDGRFAGVDIDYEGKLAATKDSFSLFLKELKRELGKRRVLTCAIEARTPADSLYRTVPTTIAYANDLVAIGTHCDRVQIMAYDQQRADIKLNDARKGAPYIPVADAAWVRKVALHMSGFIPKEKLLLGIPTYGHEYELVVAPEWYKSYARVRALNPDDALELADAKDVLPSRNAAGEMSFTYWSLSPTSAQRRTKVPSGTRSGDKAAAQALAYANATGQSLAVNVVWWSDAEAVKEKIEIAKELGLAGIALFKIDGEEDRDIWELLEDL